MSRPIIVRTSPSTSWSRKRLLSSRRSFKPRKWTSKVWKSLKRTMSVHMISVCPITVSCHLMKKCKLTSQSLWVSIWTPYSTCRIMMTNWKTSKRSLKEKSKLNPLMSRRCPLKARQVIPLLSTSTKRDSGNKLLKLSKSQVRVRTAKRISFAAARARKSWAFWSSKRLQSKPKSKL